MSSIEQFYDRVGSLYDWAERFEGNAKSMAFDRLMVSRGDRVLNVGAGTGIDHAKLTRQVGSTGVVVALDLSPVMLRLVRERTGQPVVRADARSLPFCDQSFDDLFCSYVLDLIAGSDLLEALREFHRVLRPDGRIAVITMTEGITMVSKGLIAMWNHLYRVSPIACGGCRPVRLSPLMGSAGFHGVTRDVVVEAGFPSQIIIATR